MMGLFAVIGIVLVGAIAGLAGLAVGQSRTRLTARDVHLYRRAAQIISNLVVVAGIDQPFNVLTEETRKQVNDWLASYHKEINKT